MRVKVILFGQLAEQAKQSTIRLRTCFSIDDVKAEVRKLIPDLDQKSFVISINQSIVKNPDVQLKNEDEIAFLPPFAGG